MLDLAGNVLEWCSDWAAPYPTETDAPRIDPTGPAQGTMRIMRGGCWVYYAAALRATERLYTVPHQRRNYGGFRAACDAE